MRRAPILALISALALAGAAQAQPGPWKVSDEVSILDGAHRYIATVEGDVKVFGDEGGEETPLLSMECSWNGFSVRIIWPNTIEPAQGSLLAEALWKVDDGPVGRSIWGVTGKSLTQAGPSALDWMRRLAGGKKLVVRVPDRHGGQDTSFSLVGLAPILDHISQMPCLKGGAP